MEVNSFVVGFILGILCPFVDLISANILYKRKRGKKDDNS